MVKSVLFVCLGNICRSPMAEAVFAHLIKEKSLEDQWTCDSAALGSWHVGNSPDHRALKVLKEKKIEYSQKARKITTKDFVEFDYIFAMDKPVFEDIKKLKKRAPEGSKAEIDILGKYDPKNELEIRDPYYDDDDKGFYKCYEQCIRSCTGFIESVK